MTRQSKTWMMIGGAVMAALAAEMVTVLVWGHPMSWAMADASEIVVFVTGLIGGGLASHFWWPARARWPIQDEVIERFDDPDHRSPGEAWHHARALWRIHTGEKP